MHASSTTATVETVTSEINTPPITCAPWCRDGSGHVGRHPDDQYCSAQPYLELDLTREPSVEITAGSGRYFRQSVSITLEKDPFSDPFFAVYFSCEGRKAWAVEEARQIRDHLSTLLEIVDSVG